MFSYPQNLYLKHGEEDNRQSSEPIHPFVLLPMEALQHSVTPLNISRSPSSSFPAPPSCRRLIVTAWRCDTSRRSSYAGGSQSFAAKVRQQAGSRSSSGLVMMLKDSAVSYASALVEIGQVRNILETLNADVKKLATYLEDPAILQFLRIPVIKDAKKKEVLKDLAKEAEFQPYTTNLLQLLVDKRCQELLPQIVKEFEIIYNEITDTEVAVVTSATKLTTSQLSSIAQKIQGLTGAKNVNLKNVIDPSVIAGFIISYGKGRSRLIDLSVKGQLARIAQKISFSEQVALT